MWSKPRLWIPAGLLAVMLGALASMVNSGYEQTQIRNSMIATPGNAGDFDWAPADRPLGFRQETMEAPEEFRRDVAAIQGGLPASADELQIALAFSRHLAAGPGPGGGGIKSRTRDTYREILSTSRGYCSDYTQVMNGLAHAAGVSIREWGMSFDAYSGNGHAFNEVYVQGLSKWVFVDSFYSFYVVERESGVPLSALEFRERLASGAGEDEIEVRVIAEEQFGFKDPSSALMYYRDGADRFFLYFGNNVFSYDEHPLVRLVAPLSRAAEELAAIALRIRPEIRLLQTGTNGDDIESLFRRRQVFFSLLFLCFVLGTFLGFQLRTLRRSAR
jgi:hypothetical protein